MFSDKEYIKFINSSKNRGLDIVGASVIQTLGSTYAKVGNMILVNSLGEFTGVLGSPALHNKILELSKEALENKEPIFFENTPKDKDSGHGISKYLIQAFFSDESYNALGQALQTHGKTLVRSIKYNSFEIVDEKKETKLLDDKFYQVIEKAYSLLIFGSGAHVSSLIQMANLMGWKTTVIDMKVRESFIKDADEVIKLNQLEDILTMDLSQYNASVILSHSPKTDDTYLEALLKSKAQYIGIMGNKNNMKKKREQFNIHNDKRFFAPVGLDIGGITHQSIALSICAQIEAVKNEKLN